VRSASVKNDKQKTAKPPNRMANSTSTIRISLFRYSSALRPCTAVRCRLRA
jgi:hypothetical protein